MGATTSQIREPIQGCPSDYLCVALESTGEPSTSPDSTGITMPRGRVDHRLSRARGTQYQSSLIREEES